MCYMEIGNVDNWAKRRLFMRGLLSFYAVCAIGTVLNVSVAIMLFRDSYSWWSAGIEGVLVGAVWNYTTISIFNLPQGSWPMSTLLTSCLAQSKLPDRC